MDPYLPVLLVIDRTQVQGRFQLPKDSLYLPQFFIGKGHLVAVRLRIRAENVLAVIPGLFLWEMIVDAYLAALYVQKTAVATVGNK